MKWAGKRVLVTGAGGFIGSHLTERLLSLGASVRACVRYNSRNSVGFLEGLEGASEGRLEIVRGNVAEFESVQASVQDCAAVFHLAALIGIPYSYMHPREVVETNTVGTLNMLLACRSAKVERLLITSTSEVYGSARYVPIDEEHPLQAQSPYAASKIAADKIAESFHRSFALPVTVVRPFNTYGPRQSLRAVIPTIITQALRSDVVRLGSLKPTRDFTFVDDTVEGFIKAAESPRTIGETINLGTNSEISVGEVAQRIAALCGRPVRVEQEEQRLRPQASEVTRLWSNNAKAKSLMGWKPLVSLDEGLRRTIEWVETMLPQDTEVARYHV
jgi:dTDP-glucose 4,6-dehydratase